LKVAICKTERDCSYGSVRGRTYQDTNTSKNSKGRLSAKKENAAAEEGEIRNGEEIELRN